MNKSKCFVFIEALHSKGSCMTETDTRYPHHVPFVSHKQCTPHTSLSHSHYDMHNNNRYLYIALFSDPYKLIALCNNHLPLLWLA